jgi:hypothetical protein
MKRIIALVIHALWRMTAPVRRPLAVRFDARVSRLVSDTVNARMMPPLIEALDQSGHRLARIETILDRTDRAATHVAEEVDVVLNGLSREIFRLQAQVELLQRTLRDDMRFAANNLSIVNEAGEESPLRRPTAPAERSRVG